MLVKIVRDHGTGGRESEARIVLELDDGHDDRRDQRPRAAACFSVPHALTVQPRYEGRKTMLSNLSEEQRALAEYMSDLPGEARRGRLHGPRRDSSGQIQEIPTGAFEKFGYGLEFDEAGRLGALRIDFEAVALHLAELKRSAAHHQVRIACVIFDPKLRKHLAATTAWKDFADLPFMLHPAWVRHDEHYHVDFNVSCQSL